MPAIGSDRVVADAPPRGRALTQIALEVRRGLWLVDAFVAGSSMLLAHALSPVFRAGPGAKEALAAAAVYAAAFVFVGYGVGLYDWNVGLPRLTLFFRLLVSSALSAAATLGYFYLVFYRPIGRWVVAYTVLLSAPLAFLPRNALWLVLRHRRQRVLFAGGGALADRLIGLIEGRPEALYEVVGRWRPGAREELIELCRTRGVDEIVLPTGAAELEPVLVHALHCLPLGCRLRSEADFHEDLLSAVPVMHVPPEWMLAQGLDTSNHLAEAIKRLTDIALAVTLLVVSAPVHLLAMLALAVQGGGPVFYRQVRVGRHGRPFSILKLRSMRMDAETGAAQWASPDDARATPVGRILRRTRLDELPQLLNILVGEMSFVGPRPERPEFVAELERTIPFYSWRHFVRPGLTGWAQINYPYGSSVEDARRKLEYDLFYIRHYSVLTDLSIALRTATAAARGAR
jgi:exopolysaccharide biosynthesis polyprenyl glycosylphosphotransferase